MVCIIQHVKLKIVEPMVTKFCLREDLKARWFWIYFGCKRKGVAVARWLR